MAPSYSVFDNLGGRLDRALLKAEKELLGTDLRAQQKMNARNLREIISDGRTALKKAETNPSSVERAASIIGVYWLATFLGTALNAKARREALPAPPAGPYENKASKYLKDLPEPLTPEAQNAMSRIAGALEDVQRVESPSQETIERAEVTALHYIELQATLAHNDVRLLRKLCEEHGATAASLTYSAPGVVEGQNRQRMLQELTLRLFELEGNIKILTEGLREAVSAMDAGLAEQIAKELRNNINSRPASRRPIHELLVALDDRSKVEFVISANAGMGAKVYEFKSRPVLVAAINMAKARFNDLGPLIVAGLPDELCPLMKKLVREIATGWKISIQRATTQTTVDTANSSNTSGTGTQPLRAYIRRASLEKLPEPPDRGPPNHGRVRGR